MQVRRKMLAFACFATAFAGFPGSVHADHITVRRCFQLKPFTDFVDLTVNSAVRGHRAINGIWVAPGANASGGVSGSLERDVPGGSGFRYTMTGMLRFPSGILQLVALDAKINGEWKAVFTAAGGSVGGNSGTPFQEFDCLNPPSSAAAAKGSATGAATGR